MTPTTEELRALRDRATKGPLIVDDYGDQTGHATRIAFPDRFGIPSEGVGLAFQNWKDAEDKDQRISWAEAEANAKLWAIAPDLLDEVLRLRAERDALRDAIEPFAVFFSKAMDGFTEGYAERQAAKDTPAFGWNDAHLMFPDFMRAVAALKGGAQ